MIGHICTELRKCESPVGYLAHHMFTVGMDVKRISFFSALTALIGIPTGVKVISWVSMLTTGSVGLGDPVVWWFGGITEIVLSASSVDISLHDLSFVSHCIVSAVGFNLCFFPMHYFGMCCLPRRVCVYDSSFYWMNGVCTMGRFLSSFSACFLCIYYEIRWWNEICLWGVFVIQVHH
ncbi:unnamed protein product [Protopolystoma xenopodis]|uniref:Cytochrome c oxidase subunit 1 n=1 Tax=Protopolystoma xenopodis TaxID=117903 RepID=A0A3S5AJA8_9PLAT|nr:unnamed protein product [Protopolystoma xenopodis]